MSIKHLALVWDYSRQRGTALLMLLSIADCANNHGQAHVGVKYLSNRTRMSYDNAYRLLRNLEATGEVGIKSLPNAVNTYTLLHPNLPGNLREELISPTPAKAPTRKILKGWRIFQPPVSSPIPRELAGTPPRELAGTLPANSRGNPLSTNESFNRESSSSSSSSQLSAINDDDDDDDDPRLKILRAAGIHKVEECLKNNPTVEDILAVLAFCYDPERLVRIPEKIAVLNLSRKNLPAAYYYEPNNWLRFIPDAILTKSGVKPYQDQDVELPVDSIQSVPEPEIELSKPTGPGFTQRTKNHFDAVMGQLKMDMPKSAFDTWIVGTWLYDHQDDGNVYVIGCRTEMQVSWLESRLLSTITHLLTGMSNAHAGVRFVMVL